MQRLTQILVILTTPLFAQANIGSAAMALKTRSQRLTALGVAGAIGLLGVEWYMRNIQQTNERTAVPNAHRILDSFKRSSEACDEIVAQSQADLKLKFDRDYIHKGNKDRIAGLSHRDEKIKEVNELNKLVEHIEAHKKYAEDFIADALHVNKPVLEKHQTMISAREHLDAGNKAYHEFSTQQDSQKKWLAARQPSSVALSLLKKTITLVTPRKY